MNFYERNDYIKNINEQKIKKLEFERAKELLKECTFEPFKKNKKLNINPIEISNRLYYNNSYKNDSNTDIINKNDIKPKKKIIDRNSNIKIYHSVEIFKKKIYLKMKIFFHLK